MIKDFLINNLTFLGKYKRFFKALKDSLNEKTSYSQFGEDVFIYNFISRHNLSNSIYVDIGANHPTSISNTYLLYRKGFSGIIIEPNKELINLYKYFRKKDIAICIGCADYSAIQPFYVSKTPVLSSFVKDRNSINTHRVYYAPIMKVDDALVNFDFNFISLLSIDVEGINYEVLLGSGKILKKTLMICLEYDSMKDRNKYVELLENQFLLVKEFGCNLLFVNTTLSEELKLR